MSELNFITIYFTEEKIEGLFFIILGAIGLALGFIFSFIIKYSFFKGMAIPLILIGCIQILVGTIVVWRSPKDIMRVEQQMNNIPDKIRTDELPRMENVMKNFMVYKWIEIVLMVLGVILFFVFYNSTQAFWKGLGIGLLLQAGIMLSLDLIAEKRAKIYVGNLLASISKLPH